MTLVELMEYCRSELRSGKSRQSCEEWLQSAGVHPEVIRAVMDGFYANGDYRNLEGEAASKEICLMFDCQMMTDIKSSIGAENYLCYALGNPGDRMAGITYHTVTPWFDSMRALFDHCETELEQYRRQYNGSED